MAGLSGRVGRPRLLAAFPLVPLAVAAAGIGPWASVAAAQRADPADTADTAPADTAPADTAVRVRVGAFVDAYYAWDGGRPPSFDRSFAGGTPFTTQPARHDEFNVNLAFVEVTLDGARVRGRLAVQAGTSVQANYAGEPTNGRTSGPSLARLLQEAVVGARVADAVWIEGGIFFSHVGMESWISRDNPTYTRSLVAEYSPYYSAGVRAIWQASPRLTAHLHVVNGWQVISETNAAKGVGVRLDYAAAASTTVSYYGFLDGEGGGAGGTTGTRVRAFNGLGARATLGAVTLLGQLDLGTQARARRAGGTATWYGFTAVVRARLTRAVAVSGRVERYDDPDQVIVATGAVAENAPNGPLRANGASFGVDVGPFPRLLWRSELRGFANATAVFPGGRHGTPRRSSVVAVSSLALTL